MTKEQRRHLATKTGEVIGYTYGFLKVFVPLTILYGAGAAHAFYIFTLPTYYVQMHGNDPSAARWVSIVSSILFLVSAVLYEQQIKQEITAQADAPA